MAARDTRHHTVGRLSVEAESSDTLGLNLDDLRRFIADAETAGMDGKSSVTVSRLSSYATINDQAWYRVKGIEVHEQVANPKPLGDGGP